MQTWNHSAFWFAIWLLFKFKCTHVDLNCENIWHIGITNQRMSSISLQNLQDKKCNLHCIHIMCLGWLPKTFITITSLDKVVWCCLEGEFCNVMTYTYLQLIWIYFELQLQFFLFNLKSSFKFFINWQFFLLALFLFHFTGDLIRWYKSGRKTFNKISTRGWWFFKWSL